MSENEVAKAGGVEYPLVVAEDREAIVAELRREMQGSEFTVRDLPRANFPSGKSLRWVLSSPNADGEMEPAKIRGVVVGEMSVRRYWASSIEETGSGSPPDCYSDDLIQGHGNPGVLCEECAFSKPGSEGESGGQACHKRGMVFVMEPGAYLPTLIEIPRTSLQPWTRQKLGFLKLGKAPSRCELIFSFESAKASGGQDYAKLKVELSRDLTPEEQRAFAFVRENLVPSREDIARNRASSAPASPVSLDPEEDASEA